ncbi:5'-AMP-activated protein kinase subunit beta-2 [Sciurus carolinensis]|uniref:5'-AMP-activated protein kinase subunit beta-2 n=1 Tax=Sciurus carolinensis TaxID=30640 RepID=A0AA41N881_SCICA|nr:5'-AMP-activated protein kinase subunit beta-2 [Sciurus carolinensis]
MGNTTSDQVSREHRGAKAACAEGDGPHAPGKEHKIMVGNTNDPGVFSLPNSKVPVSAPLTMVVQLLLGFRASPPFFGSFSSH